MIANSQFIFIYIEEIYFFLLKKTLYYQLFCVRSMQDLPETDSEGRKDKYRYLYKGERISFKVLDINLPNGRLFKKEIVEHPGAVVILPLLNDKVIFLKQFRYALNRWVYELPAGTLDKQGESLEKCALRELEEETGYIADHAKEMFRMYSSPGFSTEIIYSFLVEKMIKSDAKPEETEIIKVIELSFNKTLELIREDKIVDAKTIASLLYYDKYIRKKIDKLLK